MVQINPFDASKAGALVGTITSIREHLRVIYAMIGNRADGSSVPPGFAEIRLDGTCTVCNGLGTVIDIVPERMIAAELSLKQGAVLMWAGSYCAPVEAIKQLARMLGIYYDKPLIEQDERFIDILLYGYNQRPVSYVYKKKATTAYYRGCVNDLRHMRDAGTKSKGNRKLINYFTGPVVCPLCEGTKLSPESRSVTIQGRSYATVSRMSVPQLLAFIRKLPSSLDTNDLELAGDLIAELEERLAYLDKIGLKRLMQGTD
jgi:excinuclease UvrABC ATPase subunit